MRDWATNRGIAEDPFFARSLQQLGIDRREFDDLAPKVEEVLCGATIEKLDAEYPATENE